MDRVALGRISKYFSFHLSVSYHQCSVLILTLLLLLSCQGGEALEPSKQCSFGCKVTFGQEGTYLLSMSLKGNSLGMGFHKARLQG